MNVELVSSDMQRISDYMSFVSFAVSLISIFGFRRYKQQYRARYSRDVFKASACFPPHSPEEAAQPSSLGGEDYVHIIIDLFTLSFVCASNYLSLKQVGLESVADPRECRSPTPSSAR